MSKHILLRQNPVLVGILEKKKRQRGMNVNFWSDSDFAGSLYERGDDVQQIVYNCKRSSLNPIEGLKLLN